MTEGRLLVVRLAEAMSTISLSGTDVESTNLKRVQELRCAKY